jgi:hypothetical protein
MVTETFTIMKMDDGRFGIYRNGWFGGYSYGRRRDAVRGANRMGLVVE